MTTDPYTGHPGSALDAADRGIQLQAAAAAVPAPSQAPAAAAPAAVPVTGTVRAARPVSGSYATPTLDTNNPYLPILAQDPRRARAVLMTSTTNVLIVCATKELAQEVAINGNNAMGGGLINGVPLELTHTGEVWVASTTPGTPHTVSVFTERYDDDGEA